MDQIEGIVEILESVKLSNDDDELLQLETEIILHWERLTCEIGFRSEAMDGFFFEVIPIQTNKRKDLFVRDLISALTKFAIVNLCMFIKLSEFRQKYLFQTASCATLLDKVQELSGTDRRDLFKVTFNHEGCEVDLLFFIATKVGCENMLITAGYYNPVATNELVMKLLNSANDYPFLDTVGFIGILSGDRLTTVRHCVQIAHQTVVQHAALMKQQKDEARRIENWYFTRWEDLDDTLFNTQPKENNEESATKHRRNLRSTSHKQEFVDLTVTSIEVEKIKDTMLVSDDSFHSLVCSDILMTGPPLGDFHDGLSEGFKDGWDDNTLALKPIFDQIFRDKMKAWLKQEDVPGETDSCSDEEMRDETSHLNRTVPITPRAPHKDKPSAEHFYQEKAERDYSDKNRPSIHRKTVATLPDTVSKKKHPHRLNPDIGIRLRLLDEEDYKKNLESEKMRKEKKFAESYKIPKLNQPSPDQQRSSSTTCKRPPDVTSRSPIRPPVGARYTEHKTSHGESLEEIRSASLMRKIVLNAPTNAFSPNGYEQDYSPRSEARSSRNSGDIGSNAHRDEVISVDEDDDQDLILVKDENSDTNNNKSRKRLFSLAEPAKPNKIFLTKKDRTRPKPDFSRR